MFFVFWKCSVWSSRIVPNKYTKSTGFIMVSAFIGWKRVESLMVPWKSKRINSRHNSRHNLVPVDCFWSFFYVWFYQKNQLSYRFLNENLFLEVKHRASQDRLWSLVFQPKKLKNVRFYKVFGVLRFHSFCIYFHKFYFSSFSQEYNKTNGFLYFVMVQRVSFRHHFPFIFLMFF